MAKDKKENIQDIALIFYRGMVTICNRFSFFLRCNANNMSSMILLRIEVGEKSTLAKLEPILSQHIKDLEMIAPTISGNLIKKLKEI